MVHGDEGASKARRVVGLVGCILLTLAATYFLGRSISPIWESQRVADWERSEARVEVLWVDPTREESPAVHQLKGRYSYTYAGRQYQGQRMALHGGLDRWNSLQEQLYVELSQAGPVPVWVNPDDPSQSILTRELRWGTVFAGIFIYLLLGTLYLCASVHLANELSARELELPPIKKQLLAALLLMLVAGTGCSWVLGPHYIANLASFSFDDPPAHAFEP